jgi:hypothetical protein
MRRYSKVCVTGRGETPALAERALRCWRMSGRQLPVLSQSQNGPSTLRCAGTPQPGMVSPRRSRAPGARHTSARRSVTAGPGPSHTRAWIRWPPANRPRSPGSRAAADVGTSARHRPPSAGLAGGSARPGCPPTAPQARRSRRAGTGKLDTRWPPAPRLRQAGGAARRNPRRHPHSVRVPISQTAVARPRTGVP